MPCRHSRFSRSQCLVSFLCIYCLRGCLNSIIIHFFLLSFHSIIVLSLLCWSEPVDRKIGRLMSERCAIIHRQKLHSNQMGKVFSLCLLLRPRSSVPQCRSLYFHVFQLLGARPHSSNAFSWCTSDISLESKMQSELTATAPPRNQAGIAKWCHVPPHPQPGR